jgi:protocatechuate 3,4-dioxygenase, alpha subunit
MSTPSQTVGPFLSIVLPWPDGPAAVPEGTRGALLITGQLTDGAGDPVPDGLVETWQSAPDLFGRCATDANGTFWFRTVKPAPLPAPDGTVEAPHIDVSVFSRGLLQRLVTRIYFADETVANAADPVLTSLSAADRALLTAAVRPDGTLRFDIRLQGDRETPFFAV